MAGLRNFTVSDFTAHLLRTAKEQSGCRFALFLGAGCSVSSGIKTAGDLVAKEWLPRLRGSSGKGMSDDEWRRWIDAHLDNYEPEKPHLAYGSLIDYMFREPGERQGEIERICTSKDPGFGYAILATLIAQDHGQFNVVLTTNFDDLLADAMYLFAGIHPLVIPHESLTDFVRPTRTRPLIVKVHGDHQLAPLNANEEIRKLRPQMDSAIKTLLHDRGIVFVGYRGLDDGVLRTLSALPTNALPFGIYWVHHREPEGLLRTWLDRRNATWVQHKDFDEFMLRIRDAFGFEHPSDGRITSVFANYHARFRELSGEIEKSAATTPESVALKEAAKRADKALPDAWAYVLRALKLESSDADAAFGVYLEGIERFPTHYALLNNGALLLTTIRRDYDLAEQLY